MPPLPNYSELFVIDQVGREYYEQHFRLIEEERMGEYLYRAVFSYTFKPYVNDHTFVLWLDLKKWEERPEPGTCILLDPQAFVLMPEDAEQLAVQHGLAPGSGFETRVAIDAFTNYRFAWEVKTQAPSSGAVKMYFDVETGQVYSPAGSDQNPWN